MGYTISDIISKCGVGILIYKVTYALAGGGWQGLRPDGRGVNYCCPRAVETRQSDKGRKPPIFLVLARVRTLFISFAPPWSPSSSSSPSTTERRRAPNSGIQRAARRQSTACDCLFAPH